MPNAKEFGKYLKQLREDRKLTIHQVETYSGVSNSYVSLFERGKRGIPSPAILKKLSPVYKTPYDELMRKAGYTEEEIMINEGMTHEVGVKSIEQVENEKLEKKVLELAQYLSETEITLIEEIKKENFSIKDLYEILKTVKALQQNNDSK